MCRNIRRLYNIEPPVSDDEIRDAALQYVRKISGYKKPSRANDAVFNEAVEEIARASRRLLDSLETNAEPKSRVELAERARARSARRNAS